MFTALVQLADDNQSFSIRTIILYDAITTVIVLNGILHGIAKTY